MNNWKYLPVEILNLVFDGITSSSSNAAKDFYQCQLTCKNWSEPAQRRLYESISIRCHITFMKLFATVRFSDFYAAQFLKEITYHGRDAPDIEFLHLLLLSCPNIEKLYCDNEDYYIRFFEQIRLAYERGACKRIQYVDGGSGKRPTSYYQMYLDTMYCLRNSLHDLSIMDNFKVQPHTTHSPLQTLNEFSALRTLNIKISCMKAFYFIGKYTENCRKLEKLQLHWCFNINTYEDIAADVHSLIRCPTIQHLHLSLPLTKKALEFIIHAFPNLDVLIASFHVLGHSTNTIPNSLWVNFLAFLQNTKRIVAVEPMFIDDIPGVIAGYFHTRKLNARLYISHESSYGMPCLKTIKDRAKTGHGDISIELQLPMMQSENESIFFTLLLRAGSLLYSLIFDGAAYDLCGYVLDDAAWNIICQKCTSLEYLKLISTTIKGSTLQLQQTNTSIRNITMEYCDISYIMFPILSIRLPLLSNLSLMHCGITNRHKSYPRDYYNAYINMPNTSFDTLSWTEHYPRYSKSKFKRAIVRIDISSITYLYIGKKDGSITRRSIEPFQKFWKYKRESALHIRCQDIKKLNVIYDNYSWEIVFTEL
jgi:hypothetical protein